MSLDNYHPRMGDELTDAVILIRRATGCLQTINECRNILDAINNRHCGKATAMMIDHDPKVIVDAADSVLRVLITESAQLETVRASIEELLHTLDGDYQRRVADRLHGRPLTLYGIGVS